MFIIISRNHSILRSVAFIVTAVASLYYTGRTSWGSPGRRLKPANGRESGPFDHEADFALFRLPVCCRNDPFCGGRCRGRRAALALFQGSSGLFPAPGL